MFTNMSDYEYTSVDATETTNTDFFTTMLSSSSTMAPSAGLNKGCTCTMIDDLQNFNCLKDDYLRHCRGPKTQAIYFALPVTIFYLIVFIAGILGNAIVCIVIIRNASMHTATNYYLFSLAMSDLLYLLFGLPFEIITYWHQYPFLFGLPFCKIRKLMTEACSYVSVLTIVAFSMERFLAICHPLHLYTMSGFKRAVRIIAIIWTISFLCAAPFAYHTGLSYLKYPPVIGDILPESVMCSPMKSMPIQAYDLSLIVFFVIPMIIICLFYIRMAIEIRFRSIHTHTTLGVRQGSIRSHKKQTKSRRGIIKMLAVVVITFFVCWAPFHAQRVMIFHGRHWKHFQLFYAILFPVSGVLYYISCTINPIIYNVMSQRYRAAFRKTLCGNKNGNNRQTNGSIRTGNGPNYRDTVVMHISCSEPSDMENGIFSRARSMRLSRYKSNHRRGSSISNKLTIVKENIIVNNSDVQ